MRWIYRRATLLMVCSNLFAILAMGEALRTTTYISRGVPVPRNPLQLSAEESQIVTVPSNLLLEYRVNRTEESLKEVREDIKELRADFAHITQMLIGSLVAVVINLAITVLTRRKHDIQEPS